MATHNISAILNASAEIIKDELTRPTISHIKVRIVIGQCSPCAFVNSYKIIYCPIISILSYVAPIRLPNVESDKIPSTNFLEYIDTCFTMELTEIPQLILKIFRYTSSTKRSWLISIALVVFITAFAFDLSYGFVFNRVKNVENTSYDANYWMLLGVVTVGIATVYTLYTLLDHEYKLRKFNDKKKGVGIVPFDIISIKPDTLSSFDKMRTLDEVMYQLFLAIDHLLDDNDYSELFECRVLPLGLRIHNKQSSIEMQNKIGAVLIIRGILKEDAEGLSLDLFFQGSDNVELNETIILKKDVIDSIANMIRISSYVSISIIKMKEVDSIDDKERIKKEIKDIVSYLDKSIKLYEKMINYSLYRTESSLHQKLEDLLDQAHAIYKNEI